MSKSTEDISPIYSVEQALHQTLKRLWTHGKRSEIEDLLSFAQFPVDFKNLDQWVRLDEFSRKKAVQLHLANESSDKTPSRDEPHRVKTQHKPFQEHRDLDDYDESEGSIKNKAWIEKPESSKSIEIPKESISIDLSHDQSLANRLGLNYNSPYERHKMGSELARGGVGRISRSRDRQLLRSQVLKTLNKGNKASERVMLNFIREAQITAQLEHPHIVPVHDLGLLPNGEVYFTMKRIRGYTLKELIRGLRKNNLVLKEKYPRVKLLEIFIKTCQAIAFAHNRGVLHRDLKPSNVMVGDFGEVLVLDWGVAKVFHSNEVKQAIRCPEGDGVGRSSVVGTPSYMSPEQAIGDHKNINVYSDVYSLGAILYEILTYRPPFRGKDSKVLIQQAIDGNPIPPRTYRPTYHIPQALEEITMNCLAKEQSKRYHNVEELIKAVVYYLNRLEDLERRFKLCHQRYIEASNFFKKYRSLLEKQQVVIAEQIELQWSSIGKNDSKDRRPLWLKSIELQELKIQIQEYYHKTEGTLRDALSHYADHYEAKSQLAYLYSIQLEMAEEEQNSVSIDHYQDLLEKYDQGKFKSLLHNRGKIQIITHPLECTIHASKGVEMDLDLKFLKEQPWGKAPLSQAKILSGHWLIRITAEGYQDAIYPILVKRNHIVDIQCTLFKPEELSKNFTYIPKGKVKIGDESQEYQKQKVTEVNVDSFAMSKTLITCGDYLNFLNHLHTINPDKAKQKVPRLPHLNIKLWKQDKEGNYALPEASKEMPWSKDWPIFAISYRDAQSFCRWFSIRLGFQVRLPTVHEWEKAARGLDTRIYPWGNYFDESFCHTAIGRLGSQMYPLAIKQVAKDCSPYGIYDMAGLVSEFCDVSSAVQGQFKFLKGGNFACQTATRSHCAHQVRVNPQDSIYTAGFRVVRELHR
jgi:eukaryotic-like serine/threonine-protein kinase